MFEKLKAFYAVFTAGQVVANPVAWKKGQITGGAVAGLLGALVALAKGFGYEIPLSDDQLLQIGGAVVAIFGLFNVGATVVSTDKIGLPGLAPAGPTLPPVTAEHVDAVLANRATRLQPIDSPAQPPNAPAGQNDYAGGN